MKLENDMLRKDVQIKRNLTIVYHQHSLGGSRELVARPCTAFY